MPPLGDRVARWARSLRWLGGGVADLAGVLTEPTLARGAGGCPVSEKCCQANSDLSAELVLQLLDLPVRCREYEHS